MKYQEINQESRVIRSLLGLATNSVRFDASPSIVRDTRSHTIFASESIHPSLVSDIEYSNIRSFALDNAGLHYEKFGRYFILCESPQELALKNRL